MTPPSNSTASNSSCALASMCGDSSSSSNSTASTTNNEINSVRELNRLLESALRNMGGDEDECSLSKREEIQPSSSLSSTAEPSSPGNGINIIATGTSHSNSTGTSSSCSEMVGDAASWRLDTARRLSSVSRYKVKSRINNDFIMLGKILGYVFSWIGNSML